MAKRKNQTQQLTEAPSGDEVQAPVPVTIVKDQSLTPVQAAIDAGNAHAAGVEAAMLQSRDQRVTDLEAERTEIQQRLDAIDAELANAGEAVNDPIEVIAAVPKCSPLYDPTLRSPRNRVEAQKMVEVRKSNESLAAEQMPGDASVTRPERLQEMKDEVDARKEDAEGSDVES
jgi:hypothetical protein